MRRVDCTIIEDVRIIVYSQSRNRSQKSNVELPEVRSKYCTQAPKLHGLVIYSFF